MRKREYSYVVLGILCGLLSVLNGCGDSTVEFSASGGDGGTPSSRADGSGPSSGLILARDGNSYGTTARDSQFDRGTVFRITPGGDEAVLYSFAGGTADGVGPSGGLAQGSDGNFYGTTRGGGISACAPDFMTGSPTSCGTVFKVTPDGKETVLHVFGGANDGHSQWSLTSNP